ncbi:hypothetical protein LELG_00853 [Lodderomyces elongisporus NRRL YB-4239]|uniref:Exosome complex protein n=1 Tax=Lodderomyces elongisporus (strain ATCC 11503 / CBS 2605 / JCM 1781 / NBRC 1676 / NRRL YB-4239) TaxID=379508 RepID=A5DU17_LODEL|nr:hypothetical protein LELG_00853 [Lodderomyces elongisporus NRRL YB-4239]
MDNTENIKLFLKSLDLSILQYEPTLELLLSKSLDEHLAQQETAKDKIQFLNNFQYVLVSTIFSYLKTIGVNTDEHPIKNELARVKNFMMRAKKLDQNLDDEMKQKEEDEKRKAKEFITQTLGMKNGAESTLTDTRPAISTKSFQGTHTKFDNEEETRDGTTRKEQSNKGITSDSLLAAKYTKTNDTTKTVNSKKVSNRKPSGTTKSKDTKSKSKTPGRVSKPKSKK